MTNMKPNIGLAITGIAAALFLLLAGALLNIQNHSEAAANWVRFIFGLAILLISVVGGSLLILKSD